MKGRGTRTLNEDDYKYLNPSAVSNKSRCIIVDAVGVTQSLKTESRSLERNPTVSLKDLMMRVVMGARDEDTLTTLAGRLTRLDKQMTQAEHRGFVEISGGLTISDIARSLLNAFDEDYIGQCGNMTATEIIENAATPFDNPVLRDYIETIHKNHDQILDNINLDTLQTAEWHGEYKSSAESYIASFRAFIEDNKDEITALSIIYDSSWKTRPLTLKMIQEVYDAMQKQNLTTDRLWLAYGYTRSDKVKARSHVSKLIDIVALLKFELGITTDLVPYSDTINYNFMKWTMAKNAGHIHFSEEQMDWLRMIKDFIASSLAITTNDLELAPFNKHGGLGKFYQLFGDEYETLLDEINLALVA